MSPISHLCKIGPIALSLLLASGLSARPLEDLPGEEVTLRETGSALPKSRAPASPEMPSTWLAQPIDEQLARDENLLTVSKGALFVPTYSESRREPEVSIYSPSGELVRTGLTGTRILLDSGDYQVRIGSGSQRQQMRFDVRIEEGHTRVLKPTWGGLLVETLTPDGDYFEGQYEVIRIDRNGWYGRGRGLGEERLQDINLWILPPGIYRLGKVGDPASALRSYITVELHPGELQSVELVYADKNPGSEIIAGGLKTLNTRVVAGRHWTYGLRAGGNLAFVSSVDISDTRKEIGQLSSDVRLRVRYDNAVYYGLNEINLRNNFLKERGAPISVVADEATARSTWVRRFNDWVGPYLRGQISSHFFSRHSEADTIYVVDPRPDPDNPGSLIIDTLMTDYSGRFRFEPSYYPLLLSEGLGVNLDILDFSRIELSTQVGLAAHQRFSEDDYVALTSNQYYQTSTESDIGLETLVYARVRPFNFLTLDARMELFAPNAEISGIQLTDLEMDLRLTLSRFVELGYLFQINEITEAAANSFPSSHSLSIRFNLNY